MKRTIMVMLLITTAVFVFAQNSGVFIREMSGTVELQTQGSTGWTPARLNEPIRESTIVSTGFKSTAIIAVGNSTLLVQPLTRMSLGALINRDQTETVNLNLNTGKIRIDVKPPAGAKASVSVQTPSATASVRGTAFDLDTVAIQVHEGSVIFQPNGASRSVIVNAGQSSWIDPASGGAVNPLIAAKISLPLPPLPGQESRTRARRQPRQSDAGEPPPPPDTGISPPDTIFLGNDDGIIKILPK